ncbi:MAG: helix-turn-helix domain-containing protein [Sedimentibacter sp.]|uniref:helix-turn-helix domain-containing protein n=1 Tax=Sedimentibacter sp. TaxID=1960295 RepID=UPI0029827220|nr:helix-turn-helix domain-containing protein [Sedimentibacter sp.]MDW5298730.1 helix-turn-helix domain-containing protein [Sedimentibacter sp.]
MNEDFGTRLKRCLKDAGYTQVKATETLQLSKNAILNYTKGRIPEANILYELAKICNLSMEYLLTGKEELTNLTEDELNLLSKYNLLNDKNKGKVENFIDERLNEQEKNLTDTKNLA